MLFGIWMFSCFHVFIFSYFHVLNYTRFNNMTSPAPTAFRSPDDQPRQHFAEFERQVYDDAGSSCLEIFAWIVPYWWRRCVMSCEEVKWTSPSTGWLSRLRSAVGRVSLILLSSNATAVTNLSKVFDLASNAFQTPAAALSAGWTGGRRGLRGKN